MTWRSVSVGCVAAISQLCGVAEAEVPHGSYSLGVTSERPTMFDDKWKGIPSCGKRAFPYLASHSSFEVSYTGGVMVDKEEWILEGELPSSEGVQVVARRPKLEAGLMLEIAFRVSKDRAKGTLHLSAVSKDKKSLRCGDVRMLSGAYKP